MGEQGGPPHLEGVRILVQISDVLSKWASEWRRSANDPEEIVRRGLTVTYWF